MEKTERMTGILILTSYFERMNDIRFKHLKSKGVSITPHTDSWTGPTYPDLFPPKSLVLSKIDFSEEDYYKIYYQEVLSKLDPVKVYLDLNGKILLCNESYDDIRYHGKYCHRHMVADWLEYKLEQLHMTVDVKELSDIHLINHDI